MTQYRLLVRTEVLQQLAALSRAAQTQPNGLREREFRALKAGLRAVANGDEERFDGKRLAYSSDHHDLRDCAEIKLPVVHELKFDRELGPSHRLLYREFEPEDGGLPIRQVICFEHRGDDRPFQVAGARLGREAGFKLQTLRGVSNTRPRVGPAAPGEAAPIRQPLPPDIRAALAAASDVAPARGAVNMPTAGAARTTAHRGAPSGPDHQR